jgi:hypothetical protein
MLNKTPYKDVYFEINDTSNAIWHPDHPSVGVTKDGHFTNWDNFFINTLVPYCTPDDAQVSAAYIK